MVEGKTPPAQSEEGCGQSAGSVGGAGGSGRCLGENFLLRGLGLVT